MNNDTSNPGGTLNLLFSTGSDKLAETGLNIARDGKPLFLTYKSEFETCFDLAEE